MDSPDATPKRRMPWTKAALLGIALAASPFVLLLCAGLSSHVQERLQIERHATWRALGDGHETEVLVETHGTSIDRVRHEEPKPHRTRSRQCERESQRFVEKVTAESLALNALINGEAREEQRRDGKAWKPAERRNSSCLVAVHARRGEAEVAGDLPGRVVEGDVRPRQQIAFEMPEREPLEKERERLVLAAKRLQHRLVLARQRDDSDGHDFELFRRRVVALRQRSTGGFRSGLASAARVFRSPGVGEKGWLIRRDRRSTSFP